MFKYAVGALLFICYLYIDIGICQPVQSDYIIHLDFKFTAGRIELVHTNITPGKLKSFHQQHNFTSDNIYYDILNATNKKIYYGTMSDPLVSYIEYGDENGNLNRTKVVLDSAVVSIRIPYYPEIQRIDFYEITGAPDKNAVSPQNLRKMESFIINLPKEDE